MTKLNMTKSNMIKTNMRIKFSSMNNLFNLQNSLLTINEWTFYNNSVYSIRELSTTRLLFASEPDSSDSDSSSPLSNPDNVTEHELFSPEYPSNLHNKPVHEIPTNYMDQYKLTLKGMMNASIEDPEKVEKLKERYDEIDQASKLREKLRPEDISPSPTSSEGTVTDRIGKLTNLDTSGESSDEYNSPENNNSIEYNKRKLDQLGESSAEPESKRFKQDTSNVSVEDSSPQFGDIVEGGKVYIKEDFAKSSPSKSDQGDLPSGNNDQVETGTQGGTSYQGGTEGQQGKYFKQDTSDITSEGEMPSLQDLDGGE
jgi:hypothetical protein